MEKVIVFDLGGTLMQYKGMPHSWISYYEHCFELVNKHFHFGLSKMEIMQSVEILKQYNPRYQPREIEYSSEFLFMEATKHWNISKPIEEIIDSFFSNMQLMAEIYEDTMLVIKELKNRNYKIAALTNLPSSMPNRIFKKDIPEIISVLDLYVSSESCGYRKPNKAGLEYIADYYNIDIENLTFVGDEKLDIETAKNANCNSILICRDQSQKNYKQDKTICNLKELLTLDILT